MISKNNVAFVNKDILTITLKDGRFYIRQVQD